MSLVFTWKPAAMSMAAASRARSAGVVCAAPGWPRPAARPRAVRNATKPALGMTASGRLRLPVDRPLRHVHHPAHHGNEGVQWHGVVGRIERVLVVQVAELGRVLEVGMAPEL